VIVDGMSTHKVVDGVEWAGGHDETRSEVERDQRGWPVLHADEPCDGTNPMTGRRCVCGYHKGHHKDASGAEWLDEE
jgi:hypothetical protein